MIDPTLKEILSDPCYGDAEDLFFDTRDHGAPADEDVMPSERPTLRSPRKDGPRWLSLGDDARRDKARSMAKQAKPTKGGAR